jgi:hypothetical protein
MLWSVAVAVLGGAPMADVWPYAAKRLPDGSLEYVYDFTALRSSAGTPDARERHGEAAVRTFLQRLPPEAKVKVAPGTPLDLSAGRGPEARALAPSFAQVFDGAFEADNPLAKSASARLRPPLHPDEPRLLLSTEQVTFEVRGLEDAALAALELDSEALRRELWTQVARRAVKQFRATEGDAREGALSLAARVYAANACLDAALLPEEVTADPELSTAVAAALQRLGAGVDVRFAPPPYSWSRALTCAWVRLHALGAPQEQSRGGTGAVLTYLLLLEQDPKLRALDLRVRQRRDRFEGAPAIDPLVIWRDVTRGDAGRALESLGEFIDSLPEQQRVPPAFLALPSTPVSRFLGELGAAERDNAWEELATAVQDGRVLLPDASWPLAREAALVPLVAEVSKSVQLDSSWRDQARSTFALALGGALDARPAGSEPEPETLERTELRVRLMAPPWLEVEPSPELFARQANSLEALAQALTAENLQTLRGRNAEGQRLDGTLVTEARRLAARLRSLARLASPDAKAEPKDLQVARQYVADWRRDRASTRDVRSANAFFLSRSGERTHAFVLGVTRRELTVGFAAKPQVEVLGAPVGLVVETEARQRYIVPVLRSLTCAAPAARRPLERAQVRAVVDAVQRDPATVDTAVIEALRQ